MRSKRHIGLFAGSLLCACTEEAGWLLDSDLLAAEPGLVAVPALRRTREISQQLVSPRVAPDLQEAGGVPEQFYVAVHRKELGKKYFVSGYFKQIHPGGVSSGAGASAGERIVTLKVANDRLLLVSADGTLRASDTFGPDGVVLTSYKRVSYPPFDRLPGSTNYVLFDPGQSATKISATSESEQSWLLRTEIKYVQRFRAIADGITWEEVLTGYAPTPVLAGGDGVQNVFGLSMTLGMGLRAYSEGLGFKEVIPAQKSWPSYFFTSGPRVVQNTGRQDFVADHFNFNDPKKTVEWVVSPLVPAKYQRAVLDAIESWNDALGLGRKVISARLAGPDESYADDDKNYLIYDPNPALGFAFANWRTNANTGEIRGASVYIGQGWFRTADRIEAMPPHPTVGGVGAREAGSVAETKPPLALGMLGITRQAGCVLHDEGIDESRGLWAGIPAIEQAKNYIKHVTTHEVGHTLGLRHNFKGSLALGTAMEPGTSVMDYQSTAERILLPGPGSYDIAAVRLLYGASTMQPSQPFCTDNGRRSDPSCQQFDSSVDPLNKYWQPSYAAIALDYLQERSSTLPGSSLNGVLSFVRAGQDAATRTRAFEIAHAQIGVKVATPAMPGPGYRARRDALAQLILRRLWLDAAGARGVITADPPTTDAALVDLYYRELSGSLLNEDTHRSYATRRVAATILKRFQTLRAMETLQTATAKLAGELPGLVGDAYVQQKDLIAQIDALLTPYFDRDPS